MSNTNVLRRLYLSAHVIMKINEEEIVNLEGNKAGRVGEELDRVGNVVMMYLYTKFSKTMLKWVN